MLHRLITIDLCSILSSQIIHFVLLRNLVFEGDGGAGTLFGMAAALQLPSLVGIPFIGFAIDKWGEGKILPLLFVLRSCVTVIFMFLWHVPGFCFPLLAVLAFANGSYCVTRNVILPEISTSRSLLVLNSLLLRVSVAVGIAGPALAGFIASHTKPEICFLFLAALAGLIVPTVAKLPVRTQAVYRKPGFIKDFRFGYASLKASPALNAALWVLILWTLGGGLVNFAAPLLFKSRSMSISMYGFVLSFFYMGQFAVTFFIEKISSKKRLVILCFFLLQGASIAVLVVLSGIIPICTSFFFMGLASGGAQTILETFFQEKSARNVRARIISLTFSARGGSFFLAGIIGTFIADFNIEILIELAAITIASACLLEKKMYQTSTEGV